MAKKKKKKKQVKQSKKVKTKNVKRSKPKKRVAVPVILDGIPPEVLSENEILKLGRDISLYKPLTDTHAKFHFSQKRVRWLFGGNQSGKTYTNMMDLAMTALEIHPFRQVIPGGIHWAATESWDQVRDVLWHDYLMNFIPPWQVSDIQYGQERVPKKIMLLNGHTIEFKAFNQGRSLFQSRKIDTFHGDEQCHRDLQGIFQEIQARMLVKNGYISWSLSPIIPQPYLEDRIDDLPGTDDIFFVNLNWNRKSRGGYIDDDRVDELINDWAEEVQATRVEGKFSSFFGAVYKGFNKKVNVIKPFDIPSDWPRYRGFDFGFTNPFACVWLTKNPDKNIWYVYREYYKAKTGIREHIARVKRLSGREVYTASYADPENAEDRSELRKAGIPTLKAKKNVARGIELVQSKLKQVEGKARLYICSNCPHTIKEFVLYKYATPTSNREASDVPIPKWDHTLDAIRYVIYTIERKRKKGRVIWSTV